MSARSTLEWSPGAAGPLLHDGNWRTAAACRDIDPEIFYPLAAESAEPAKQVCAICPARQACLDFALLTGDRWGVFGGLTFEERRELEREVPAEPGWCRAGLHRKTPENAYQDGHCRPCALARTARKRADERVARTGSISPRYGCQNLDAEQNVPRDRVGAAQAA